MIQYCKNCIVLFKIFDACPPGEFLNEPHLIGNIIQIIMILSSVFTHILAYYIGFKTIFTRKLRNIFFFAVLFTQMVLVQIIKHIIKEKRPELGCGENYGMPSGHSACVISLLAFYILEKQLQSKKKDQILIYSIFAFTVLISRHYLLYHTVKQIILGCILGLLVAIFYFFILLKFIQVQNNQTFQKLLNLFYIINDYDQKNYYEKVKFIKS